MRDAAVGFQCVSCVSEGAKQTRSARTPYGGPRSANPAATSVVLIGINAAVWLFIMATGGARSIWVDRLSLMPTGSCRTADGQGWYPDLGESACGRVGDAIWVPGVADGAWWQLMTSAFTHVEIWHIGFNMLALWILGPQLEAVIGRARFLVLYLGSALAGSVAVLWLSAEQGSTLGASGAIFGLMAGLLVVALKVGGNVSQLLVWIGINVAITVAGASFISWQGHLGGFVGGLLIATVLVYAPRGRRTAVQIVGLAAIGMVLVVAVVTRVAVLS